jgi:hypothetical protein
MPARVAALAPVTAVILLFCIVLLATFQEAPVDVPVLEKSKAIKEQAPAPQITPDNTPQYTVPTVTLESFFSYLPSTDVVVQSPISNKITSNKKIIKRNKITTKKARAYATSKTKR